MPTDSLALTNELNSVSLCREQECQMLVENVASYQELHISVFFLNSPSSACSQSGTDVSHGCIQSLLLKFSAQELIEVRQPALASSSTAPSPSIVVSVDHTKLWAMIGSAAGAQRTGVKRKAEDPTHNKRAPGFPPSLQSSASPPRTSFTSVTPASSTQMAGPSASGIGADKKGRSSKNPSSHLDMEIESLLNQQSTKEQQSKKVRRKRRATNNQ